MGFISINKQVKKLVVEAIEFKKLGDNEMAQNILKLAVHTEQLRTQPKPIFLPAGCSLIQAPQTNFNDENMEILSTETKNLLSKVVRNWQSIRDQFVEKRKNSWDDHKSIIGTLWWDNPNLVWILVTDAEEGYEGSQSQVGVDKEGNLRWEFQSHCSCNSYRDSSDLPEQFTENTLKSFDFTFTKPPLDWENKMRENMEKMLLKV